MRARRKTTFWVSSVASARFSPSPPMTFPIPLGHETGVPLFADRVENLLLHPALPARHFAELQEMRRTGGEDSGPEKGSPAPQRTGQNDVGHASDRAAGSCPPAALPPRAAAQSTRGKGTREELRRNHQSRSRRSKQRRRAVQATPNKEDSLSHLRFATVKLSTLRTLRPSFRGITITPIRQHSVIARGHLGQ